MIVVGESSPPSAAPCLTGESSPIDLKAQADEHFKASRFIDAVELYERYLSSHPQDPAPAWSNLSLAAVKAGYPARAVFAAQQAMACRPRWPKAHARLGAALSACGRYVDARQAYGRAVELDPSLSQQIGQALRDVACASSNAAEVAIAEPGHDLIHRLASLQLPDGKLYLISGATDGTLSLWNVNDPKGGSGTMELATETQGHEGAIVVLLAIPSFIASGSLDGTVRLWQMITADQEDGSVIGSSLKQMACFTPNKNDDVGGDIPTPRHLMYIAQTACLLTSWTDGCLRIWNVETGALCWTLEGLPSDAAPASVTCWSETSSEGIFIAASSRTAKGQILVWQLELDMNNGSPPKTATLMASLEPESGYSPTCVFVPGPKAPQLLTGHWDADRREGRLMVWAMTPGSKGWIAKQGLTGPEQTIDCLPAAPVTALVAAGKDDKSATLLILTADGTLQTAELDGWPCADPECSSPLSSLYTLATGLQVGQVNQLHDQVLPHWAQAAQDFASGMRSKLVISPGLNQVAVACEDGGVHAIQIKHDLGTETTYNKRVQLQTTAVPGSLIFLDEGLLAASGKDASRITLWDISRLFLH